MVQVTIRRETGLGWVVPRAGDPCFRTTDLSPFNAIDHMLLHDTRPYLNLNGSSRNSDAANEISKARIGT